MHNSHETLDETFLSDSPVLIFSWFRDSKKNLSEEDKDMIVNEISLVIQNIIENSLKD